MEPKRVIHLIPSLELGGTEKQLLLILPQLQGRVASEVVCLMGRGEVGAALAKKGIPVHYIAARRRTSVRGAVMLWRHLRQRRPDIVVTYLIYADILGRITGRLARVSTIIASHRSSLFGPRWWHQVDRLTRWLVTHYTSQTEATSGLLRHVVKVPEHRITVIPNAVQIASTIRQEHSAQKRDLVIVCVANLKPEKDLPLLLRVFEKIHTRYPSLQLWLVGEGPERQRLQQQVASYASRPHIHFLGLRRDVPSILARSDIFVLPTRIEGMSNALLEALAFGLPCVTSDIPVNREIIFHGKNGLLFKTGDEDSLYQQLDYLLSHPELFGVLGTSARDEIRQKYSVEIIAKKWLRLFSQLS